MPFGRVKRAAVPTPSTLPGSPILPANVVTTPSGVTFRMTWSAVSVMKNAPAESMTMYCGSPENRASAPVPSTAPAASPALPARVDTTQPLAAAAGVAAAVGDGSETRPETAR